MKPVALTLGDPAGIGCEITLKAWKALREELCFFLIGDLAHVAHMAQAQNVPVTPIQSPAEAPAAMQQGLPVLKHALPHAAPAGRPDPANAAAVIEIIRRGVELVRRGEASALCTNPINKKALQSGAGFAFPGHTEFLAHLSNAPLPVMMLASPLLRVVPVTIHIPIAEVPRQLTADLLEATVRVTHAALRADFGIEDPRIAIAGLNPHAGEQGAIGQEERTVIRPALDRLEADGLNVTGPFAADIPAEGAAAAGAVPARCVTSQPPTRLPASRWTTSSAIARTLCRWATTTTVAPAAARSPRVRRTRASVASSKCAVGSSSRSSGAPDPRTRARPIRCRCPSDRPVPPRPMTVSIPSDRSASTSSKPAALQAPSGSARGPNRDRFSATVPGTRTGR